MTITEIKWKVRSFILSMSPPDLNITDDDDIFAIGFVNSFFTMQLVPYLEQEFNITFENEDLDIGNFRSINVISQFVQNKME